MQISAPRRPLAILALAGALGTLVPAAHTMAAAPTPCRDASLDFAKSTFAWAHFPLSKLKTDTVYQVENQSGKAVLTARAEAAASAYVAALPAPMQTPQTIGWEWKTEALVPGADNRNSKKEDAPLRVMLAFDGDHNKLTDAEKRQAKISKSLSGRDFPYALLMYIWSDGVAKETLITSAHSTRVKMLVVDSGAASLGRWQSVNRDIAADFRRAFGEAPGPLLGVAVMTDTDNTGAKALGQYAGIQLKCAGK